MTLRAWVYLCAAVTVLLASPCISFNPTCPDLCVCQDNYVTCNDFHSLDLTFLPPEADTLLMSEGEMEELPPAFFARASKLKVVEIANVNVRVVRGGALMGLSHLELLSISQSSFDIVEPDGFSGIHHINSIQISDCHFGRVGKHAFAEITNVDAWRIWSSYFASISDEAFYGLQDIHTIQIYQNNISYIGDDIFAGSKNLDYINFYMNYIQNMSNGSLSHGIKATERLIVYANTFECSCGIAWMQTDTYFQIFLSSNECAFPGGTDPLENTFRLSDVNHYVLCPTTPSSNREPTTLATILHTMAPFVVEEMNNWPESGEEPELESKLTIHEGNMSEQNAMHENASALPSDLSQSSNFSPLNINESSPNTTSFSYSVPPLTPSSPSVDSSIKPVGEDTIADTSISYSTEFSKHVSTPAPSVSSSFRASSSVDDASSSLSSETTATLKENVDLASSAAEHLEPTVYTFEDSFSSASFESESLPSSPAPLSTTSQQPSTPASSPSTLSSTSFSPPTLPPKPISPSHPESPPSSDSSIQTLPSAEGLPPSPSVSSLPSHSASASSLPSSTSLPFSNQPSHLPFSIPQNSNEPSPSPSLLTSPRSSSSSSSLSITSASSSSSSSSSSFSSSSSSSSSSSPPPHPPSSSLLPLQSSTELDISFSSDIDDKNTAEQFYIVDPSSSSPATEASSRSWATSTSNEQESSSDSSTPSASDKDLDMIFEAHTSSISSDSSPFLSVSSTDPTSVPQTSDSSDAPFHSPEPIPSVISYSSKTEKSTLVFKIISYVATSSHTPSFPLASSTSPSPPFSSSPGKIPSSEKTATADIAGSSEDMLSATSESESSASASTTSNSLLVEAISSTNQPTEYDIPGSHTSEQMGEIKPTSEEALIDEDYATARLAPVIGQKQEQRQVYNKPRNPSDGDIETTTPHNASAVMKVDYLVTVYLFSIIFWISLLYTG